MPSLVTPSIEALLPYEGGKPVEELARELGITDAIKLASNENPLGPSPKALAAARAALDGVHRYPDGAAWALRERLARFYDVKIEEIVQGGGSNELLDLAVRAFATPEHHIVFAEPAFVVYRIAALAGGVPFTAVPLVQQTHDLPAMAAAVTPRTRILFVANHAFDCIGAKSYGMRTAFVDRRKRPFGQTPHQPDLVVADFAELAATLA